MVCLQHLNGSTHVVVYAFASMVSASCGVRVYRVQLLTARKSTPGQGAVATARSVKQKRRRSRVEEDRATIFLVAWQRVWCR